MKSFIKFIKSIAKIILVISIFLGVTTAFHHIMLRLEASRIHSCGTLVKVDGYQMNVYQEGERSSSTSPVIVLMAGSGVSSPIYDYKVLYSKLSKEYEVAVLEKFGYGYSDVSGLPRDVKTMVEENREALRLTNVQPPYVLMPHSMSALEAIYWSITYPSEVAGIIGLDMAVPDAYFNGGVVDNNIDFLKTGVFFGFHRIALFYPVSHVGLNKAEYKQNKLLSYRNALNKDVYNECKTVKENAMLVSKLGAPQVPTIMFTTDFDNGDNAVNWITAQRNFAYQIPECTQYEYDCGHNLHYYKSSAMAVQILDWLKRFDQ